MKKILLILVSLSFLGCALDRPMNITHDKTIVDACGSFEMADLIKGEWLGYVASTPKRLVFDNNYNIVTVGYNNNKYIYTISNGELYIEPYSDSQYTMAVFLILNISNNSMSTEWEDGSKVIYNKI